MKTITIITSIIDTPSSRLTYGVRSVYSRADRFSQTKLTIESVRKFLSGTFIILTEFSDFTNEERTYFTDSCDLVLNLYDLDRSLAHDIHSPYKALAEGTMTVQALKYIAENNLDYDFLYKVSGRYYLTSDFNTSAREILGTAVYMFPHGGVTTTFFKLSREHCEKLREFLVANRSLSLELSYETIFKMFINTLQGVSFIDKVGLEGFVSVDGTFFSV